MTDSVVRTIVPNTTTASLLRISADSFERVPIIAWIVTAHERTLNGRPANFIETEAVSVDNDLGKCWEAVAWNDTWIFPDDVTCSSEEEAVAYAQEQLRPPRGAA